MRLPPPQTAGFESHFPEAREAFLEEWRWYLALLRGPDDRLHYIGGKGNNGGDSYLGFGQVAAVTALLLVAEP